MSFVSIEGKTITLTENGVTFTGKASQQGKYIFLTKTDAYGRKIVRRFSLNAALNNPWLKAYY